MKEKIQNHKRAVEDCPEHPNVYEVSCKGCHQTSLDYAEIRLMDLDTEIRGIIEARLLLRSRKIRILRRRLNAFAIQKPNITKIIVLNQIVQSLRPKFPPKVFVMNVKKLMAIIYVISNIVNVNVIGGNLRKILYIFQNKF